jgi:hypothetical protein
VECGNYLPLFLPEIIFRLDMRGELSPRRESGEKSPHSKDASHQVPHLQNCGLRRYPLS